MTYIGDKPKKQFYNGFTIHTGDKPNVATAVFIKHTDGGSDNKFVTPTCNKPGNRNVHPLRSTII